MVRRPRGTRATRSSSICKCRIDILGSRPVAPCIHVVSSSYTNRLFICYIDFATWMLRVLGTLGVLSLECSMEALVGNANDFEVLAISVCTQPTTCQVPPPLYTPGWGRFCVECFRRQARELGGRMRKESNNYSAKRFSTHLFMSIPSLKYNCALCPRRCFGP